jgi:plastocyanin
MIKRFLAGLIALTAAVTLAYTPPPSHAAVVAPITSVADAEQQIDYTDVTAFDDRFEPRVVTITVGSAVRWRNMGVHPHSTTSDNGYWSWGLVTGSTFSIRFLSPGTYGYHCMYHPGMTGTVVVLPFAGTPTPTPTGTWSTPTGVTPTAPLPTPTGPTPTGPVPTIPWPTPPPPPIPTSPAEAGEIVFDDTATGILQGQTDLYAVQPSGAGRRQLTNTADMAEAQPSWSPDRQHVAYTATSLGAAVPTAWGIWVLDVATGARRQLTTGPDDFEPDWRPDGSSILFTHVTRIGGAILSAELAVVATDGTGFRPIVRLSGGGTVGNPTWSPDGARIAFTVDGGSGGELYVANADGTGARRLLAHPGWDDIDPRWSPDGRYIAFSAGLNQFGPTLHDIWLADLVTGIVGTVARHPTWELRRPAWSPDSRTLVFTARHQDSPPRWAMYSVPAVGGDVSGPITSGVEPDWSSTALGGLPTPMPGATATMTPLPTPPTPPPFPTIPPPEPTVPGVTPTVPPVPTFANLTPTPEETPTTGVSATPTKGAPTNTPATPGVVRRQIFLPYAVHMWGLNTTP